MTDETIIEGMVSPDQDRIADLTKHSMSGHWLFRFTYVRWGTAGLILFGSLFLRYVVGIADIDTAVLIPVAVVIALYNTVIYYLVRDYRDTRRSAAAREYLQTIQFISIVLDYVALTVTIWVMGGARSIFLPFYLFHLILSCITLSRFGAWFSAGLAYFFLAILVLGEWLGFITARAGFGALLPVHHLTAEYVILVMAVYGVLFGLSAALLIRLAAVLQEAEIELRVARVELQRTSNMRKDFLYIALHNLQSPLGVLSMFLDNMSSGRLGQLPEQVALKVNRARERLQNMNQFLQDLQVLSGLESGDLNAETEAADLAQIATDLVEMYSDEAEAKNQTLTIQVHEGIPPVQGINRLLHEAVRNYITNAIKYTPEGGRIAVKVRQRQNLVVVEVSDTGIGIALEDQKKLFGEFVRITGKDPAMKKIAGTGLGLSIVRRVVESFGGSVGVRSRPREGSTFYIILPAAECRD